MFLFNSIEARITEGGNLLPEGGKKGADYFSPFNQALNAAALSLLTMVSVAQTGCS